MLARTMASGNAGERLPSLLISDIIPQHLIPPKPNNSAPASDPLAANCSPRLYSPGCFLQAPG